jgi:hypothetical protein
MARVAVLWVDREHVSLHASPLEPLSAALSALGAERDGEAVILPHEVLGELGDELDRHGYVWATEQRFAPRTWPEHMFEGLPPHLWDSVVDALRPLLAGPDGDRDHLGLLLFARRGLES